MDLPADGIFDDGADGKRQLTATDRAEQDSAMAKLVPYLPNSPIVVEGYSSAGAASQQYLVSRERAAAASQYIESHFHLKSDRVGILPLGERRPAKTGRKQ